MEVASLHQHAHPNNENCICYLDSEDPFPNTTTHDTFASEWNLYLNNGVFVYSRFLLSSRFYCFTWKQIILTYSSHKKH